MYPQISKELLKERAKLHQKKFRLESGLVMVEGENLIEQMISNDIYPTEMYLLEERELSPILQEKDLDRVAVYTISSKDLKRLCDTPAPQGIAALYPIPELKTLSQLSFKRAFYLNGISDPGNLGTIFRIAAAFAFDAILLSPACALAASPKVLRASLGSVFWIPFAIVSPGELKNYPARKFALEMEAPQSIKDYVPSDQPEIFIIGSESHGLDAETRGSADQFFQIEMATGMESLNAAIAAAIVAFEVYDIGVRSSHC